MTQHKCDIIDFDENGFTVQIKPEQPLWNPVGGWSGYVNHPMSWIKPYGIAPFLEETNMNTFVYRIKIDGAWLKTFTEDGIGLTYNKSKAWTTEDKNLADFVTNNLINRGSDPRLDATQKFTPCNLQLRGQQLYVSSHCLTEGRLYLTNDRNRAAKMHNQGEYESILKIADSHRLDLVPVHE